jgi:hypothetical protein
MSDELIQLRWGEDGAAQCVCLLIVPDKAIDEPGYILGIHHSGSTNKHELQALAQTAYYQFQDDELELEQAAGPILVKHQGEDQVLDQGMVLLRDSGGTIKALVNSTAPLRKLLEIANRFCTRWVRLDI